MVYFPLIVKQGDPADGMFFVEGGIVEVFVDGASGTRKKVYFLSNVYLLPVFYEFLRLWPYVIIYYDENLFLGQRY